MIQTQGVFHQYGQGEPIYFPDFDIPDGGRMLLLGPSGCGKSTLLHILGGLLKPRSGSVEINGTNMSKMSSSQLDAFRGKNIGIVFQKPHFVRSLTVMENLLLAQKLGGGRKDKKRISEILENLNIGHKHNAKTKNLSQGEQQRVAIARALVNQPSIILADEPTSALDDGNTEEVISLLEKQAEQYNATLIIVTHDTRLKDRFENRVELGNSEISQIL